MKYEINNELMKVKENLSGRYDNWKGQYFVITGKTSRGFTPILKVNESWNSSKAGVVAVIPSAVLSKSSCVSFDLSI